MNAFYSYLFIDFRNRRLLQSGQFCILHRSKLLGWRFEYVNPEDGKQEHFSI